MQLLSPDLHAIESATEGVCAGGASSTGGGESAARIDQLVLEVDRLRRVVEELAKALGETDILLSEDWHKPASPPAPAGEGEPGG